MQPIISVVIPVYNKEKYLVCCLDSVVAQTIFKQLEVIIIDDGSTDNSFAVMQEYQQKHSNINIFQQKNVGVSATRNRGISLARGKYIYFIDADDFMDSNMLEILHNKAEKENSEITVCSLKIYNVINKRTNSLKDIFDGKGDRLFTKQESIQLLKDRMIGGSTCNKLYKLNFIRENKFFFDEGRSSAEDFVFNLECFLKTNKVVFIDKPLYHYSRMIEVSLTRTAEINKVITSIELVEETKNIFYKQKFEIDREPFNIILAVLVLDILSHYSTCLMFGLEINDDVLKQISNMKKKFLLKKFLIGSAINNKNKFKIILAQIDCYEYIYRIYYLFKKNLSGVNNE